MVTREFLGLADLPRAQILRVNERLEVVMVGKHEDFMSRVLQIVLSGLESLNNS